MVNIEDSSSCLSHAKILRSIVVCAAFFFFMFASHIAGMNRGKQPLCPPNMQLRPAMARRDRLLQIAADTNNGLVYLTSPDILFMTIAKGGSTSIWYWLFLGTKGRQFSPKECRSYVQNSGSSCWGAEAVKLSLLTPEKQISILTSTETLRVAIQRNPMSRIMSSYRSKFACENFDTDIGDRSRMVPELRRHAEFPDGPPCMNISEFASALESARRKAGTPGRVLSSLSKMNPHVRPQDFYFDEIEYDIVLDTTDLQHTEYLKPIIDRLKYKDLIEGGVELTHATAKGRLMIPEKAALFLHQFALESKTGKPKLFTTKKPHSTH